MNRLRRLRVADPEPPFARVSRLGSFAGMLLLQCLMVDSRARL